MKKTFQFTLKVKDCKKIFSKDLGPAVLVIQELTFDIPNDCNKALFAAELLRQEREFIERHIEVVIAECNNE